jgi:hypothetical protein
MKNRILIFLILFISITNGLQAQTRTWSVEVSLTFPIIRIYMLQASCPISDHGNILLGLCYQNWKNEGEVKGQANAYTVILGYRQFIGDKLNLEIEFFPAYNNFVSFIDSAAYSGFETWIEYRIGYKMIFGDKYYLNIQPGLGHALYMENIWPGLNRETYTKNSLMFVPQIVTGAHF